MWDEGNRHTKNNKQIEKGKIHVSKRDTRTITTCVCVCGGVVWGLINNEGINQRSLSDCQMIDQL